MFGHFILNGFSFHSNYIQIHNQPQGMPFESCLVFTLGYNKLSELMSSLQLQKGPQYLVTTPSPTLEIISLPTKKCFKNF